VKKLFVLIAAASVMAACADSATAPTGQKRSVAPQALHDTFTCRSGYTVAYDENGNPYCVPETTATSSTRTSP
jgi:hypothetical protein